MKGGRGKGKVKNKLNDTTRKQSEKIPNEVRPTKGNWLGFFNMPLLTHPWLLDCEEYKERSLFIFLSLVFLRVPGYIISAKYMAVEWTNDYE